MMQLIMYSYICLLIFFSLIFKLLVVSANLGTIGYAVSIGWMANVFILYDSDDSPLPSGRVQLNELAWIGSMLGIGGVVGTIVIGFLADRFGRKHSLMAMAVPLTVMTTITNKIYVYHKQI